MNKINDGGPAFPGQWYDFQPCTGDQVVREQWEGMSLRQYAAIHLRVPDSGVDWLDEMIRKAQRDYFAEKAMQGLLSVPGEYSADADTSAPMETWDDFAAGAYQLADAMLKARETSND